MYRKVDSILDNDPLNYKYIDFESLNELKMNDLEQSLNYLNKSYELDNTFYQGLLKAG